MENKNSEFDPSKDFSGSKASTELLKKTNVDINEALKRSEHGISSWIHQLDQSVTFMLDQQQEVQLRVSKIDIQYHQDKVLNMYIHCRTNFENVLFLAKKLRMKISAFSAHFTVILSARPEFMAEWNDEILAMDPPAKFFETLDEIKRPVFLNINHYIIARISD